MDDPDQERTAAEARRSFATFQVDHVFPSGIQGILNEGDLAVVPIRGKPYDRVIGNIEFFPWSSIQRMSKSFTRAEYEARWDAEPGE